MYLLFYATIRGTGCPAGRCGPPAGEASADALYRRISLLRRWRLRLPFGARRCAAVLAMDADQFQKRRSSEIYRQNLWVAAEDRRTNEGIGTEADRVSSEGKQIHTFQGFLNRRFKQAFGTFPLGEKYAPVPAPWAGIPLPAGEKNGKSRSADSGTASSNAII